jgi:signal transduction histidine kinase/CheY-like chemotaxis protein
VIALFSSRRIRRLAAGCVFFLSAIVIVRGQSIAPEVGFPIVASFSSAETGAEGDAFCTIQDSKGVLYFGARTLLSFDGDRWQSTPVENGYGLHSLDFGADGRIWAAGTGVIGWFERTSDGSWKFHSLLSHLSKDDAPRGEIFHVFGEGMGATFISTDRVLRWNGSRFQIWRMPNTRRLLGFRINGTVYIHYREKGLLAMRPNGPELVLPQSAIGDEKNGILWIEAQSDRWLLATGAGLLIFRDGKTEPFAPEVSTLLRQNLLTTGIRLPDGRYAFATYLGGIVFMRADGTLDGRMRDSDGLPTNQINSLFLDREGSLWVTSASQIFRVNIKPSATVFDDRAHLGPLRYFAVTRAKGRINVLSEAGLFTLGEDGRHFETSSAMRSPLHSIEPFESGLLAGGYRGAWYVTEQRSVKIRTTDSDVITIIPSRRHSGEMLLSEIPEIVTVKPGTPDRVLVRNMPDPATSLAEDETGTIWMATMAHGVFMARPDAAIPADPAPVAAGFGLPKLRGGAHVRAMADGSIVVLADNGGWVKWRSRERFLPIENYPDRNLSAVSQVSSDNSVWVVHRASDTLAACVAQIKFDGQNARWEAHSIWGMEVIGLPRSIFAETTPTGETVLWVGGDRSVLRNVVASESLTVQPRPPLLRAFARSTVNDVPQPISGTLPYSTRSIDFEFAEPEFARRAGLRLETRIDGVDHDWIPAGRDSRRELTAIRDGRYMFRVRAVAENGVGSEPTVFAFEVAPPWWRTAPAIFAGLLALAPITFGFYRLRVRTLRRQNALLEKKVEQRTEELAEASAAKTMFVANMSHDIRNPLNGIVGLALALEDTRLDPHQREIVATLRECTTYLSSLVDDVLDFASIEAGRVELRPGPFVPSELLNSIATTLKAETADRGALLTIESDREVPPMLRGDAGRIQQILVNYVSNALKYAGGHIRLAVGVPANSPGEVEFSVTDEGLGISAVEQATLFTKFTRLADARREHVPGTGLGLAACRLLADIMGGSVGVQSQPGHGARFYLRLPLTIATEPAPVPADIKLPQTSVLLVEDTDYNAWAASAVLGKLGLTCERARNGEEAIRMFTEKRFNVVLLDRNLPDMDGTEVARRMRELETDGLRAVMLAVTAYCTAEDRAVCLQAGMDAFVGKPLTPDKLRKVLIDAGRRLLATASVDTSVENASHTSPELDTTLLDYLSDGTSEGIAEQAERFIATLNETEAQLAEAITAGDFDTLAANAHRVLGQARMIGATTLAEAATRLENAAQDANQSACRDWIKRVNADGNSVKAALRRRRSAAPKA